MGHQFLSRWMSAARVAAVLGLALGTLVTVQPTSASASSAGVQALNATCAPVTIPVALYVDKAATSHISGKLCTPAGTAPATVQVLIAGATYDRDYWDFPFQPDKYSYVRSALNAGYATLNIDPLGTGSSSHPLSADVTMQTGGFAVHQVISAARRGALGAAFSRVILVSHSMGTALAWGEVATYHDVDGLIATGNVHLANPAGAINAVLSLYPAALDPKFASSGLDLGYDTTRPGTRASAFYNTADADPAVIAEDESLKQPVTSTYLSTYFLEDVNGDTSRIDIPVLLVVGQRDSLMCSPLGADCSSSEAVLNSEAPWYDTRSTCLRAFVLPHAGHDINLSLNAAEYFQVAQQWADEFVGRVAAQQPQGCTKQSQTRN